MDLESSEPGVMTGNVNRERTNQPVDQTRYRAAVAKLFPILKKLGFDSMRPGQDKAVINLLMGRDTVCFLPTGFGKSAIYILPTLCLDYRCLIFSPLVSLMKDQVESLWRLDLPAAQISGSQTKAENDMALRSWESGELKFLLVAPERISSPEFMSVMSNNKPDFVATDEAHCFQGFTLVETDAGRVSIKDLYDRFLEKSILPKVLTTADGVLVYREIKQVFKNPWKTLIDVTTDDGTLRCTEDHMIMTQVGWVEAGKLIYGEHRLLGACAGERSVRDLNRDQLSFVVGSFLGDGGLSKTSRNEPHYRLKFTHGINQKDYALWKSKLIAGAVTYVDKNGYSQTPAVMVSGAVFRFDYGEFSKSEMPTWLPALLDWKALAVWFMDDGSSYFNKSGVVNCIVLSSEDFSEEFQRSICAVLREKFGVVGIVGVAKRKEDRVYWHIRFRQADSLVFLEGVRPYMHTSMAYKFGSVTESSYVWDNKYPLQFSTVRKVDLAYPYKPRYGGDKALYDLAVDGEPNYFVHTSCGGNVSIPHNFAVQVHNCLSQWGDSFRPAYTQIGSFIDMCNPTLVLALTATATSAVETDIRRVLRIPDAHKIVYYPARKNLILSSRALESPMSVAALLRTMPGPVVVYCPTKKQCEELYNNYARNIEGGALVYHGGLDDGVRTTNQELFMGNEIRVMFATNAFGLGVNKPDIRGIIHCGFSKSVETYSQESGRAGRDGKESRCVLLHNQESYNTQMYLIDLNYPNAQLVERVMECLNSRADKDGMVSLTGAEIASALGEERRSGQVSAALSIMARYGAVERNKDEEPLSRVRILKTNDDPAMQAYMDLIVSIGAKASDGYYEFGMPMFIQGSKLKERKAKDTLTMLDRNKFIQYTKPFRGKTTRILRGIEAIDFAGLHERKGEEINKLDALRDYVETADENKHQFLLDYFGIV